MPRSHSSSRGRLGLALGGAAMAAALILTACSPSGGGTSSSGEGLSGDPIKVVSIASVDWNGPNYEDIFVTARAYEQWINANGGINGRPLEVITCDDKGDPTQTAACARDAVAAGAIADVGTFTYNAAVMVPIYAQSDTAVLGNCCNLTPEEYTTSNTFSLGSNPSLNPAGVARAAQDGCKAISLLELDIPAFTDWAVLFENAAKAYGYTGDLKIITVPLTTQDYTPQVAQATDGSDCIVMALSESNITAMMPAFAQTGGEQRLYGAQGNLDKVSTAGYESLPGVQNATVTSIYTPLDQPAWDDMRQALKDSNAPGKFDYNALSSLGAWAAYTGFTQIVEQISGDITPASFLEQASKSVVDTGGMLSPVDFTTTWDAFDGQFERSFSRSNTYTTLDGEILVDGSDIWVDLTSALETGKAN